MKVKYEFDCSCESDDKYERQIFELSQTMFRVLNDISDYLRSIRKGWEDPTVDQMEDKIANFICESRIHELE